MRYVMILLCCISFHSYAQTCLNSVDETTPDSAFIDHDDGTVTDRRTGLMWMQCSLGQTWVNGRCTGDASEFNWQEALLEAHGYRFANHGGWRLPNIKELSSITERSCVRPSVNSEIFPSTPSDDFWTSTPSVTDPDRAWVVAFFNSSNSVKDKQLFVFARLVRTAD